MNHIRAILDALNDNRIIYSIKFLILSLSFCSDSNFPCRCRFLPESDTYFLSLSSITLNLCTRYKMRRYLRWPDSTDVRGSSFCLDVTINNSTPSLSFQIEVNLLKAMQTLAHLSFKLLFNFVFSLIYSNIFWYFFYLHYINLIISYGI